METLETSSICLDTSVLIDNLRGRKQSVEFVKELEAAGALLSTTSVSSFELYYGAYRSKRQPANLASTRTLLRRLFILDLTDDCSEEAGRILAMLEARGEPIEFRDALIAATAKIHKTTLVTRNTTHFARVPDLNVLSAP